MTTPDRLAAQAEPLSELEELRRELHLMKTAGIIEVAVRNPSVSEYMEHWEGRALKAESLATPVPGAVSNAMVERAWDRLFPGNLTVISITKADLTTALEAAVQSPPIVGVRATVKALEKALLWTEEEHDVGEWRTAARAALKGEPGK